MIGREGLEDYDIIGFWKVWVRYYGGGDRFELWRSV
jgi:hypothetical protein